jgi:copper chaperone
MTNAVLKVGGMSCQGCVKSVTSILTAVPGVTKADVSLERGEANVEFEPSQVTRDDLIRAIDDGGYSAA